MKIAAIISGEPRFCEEFDLFINNLSGFDEIDWYFLLWDNNEDIYDKFQVSMVAPYWHNITEEKAFTKISENFPKTFNIRKIKVVSKKLFPMNIVVHHKAGETNVESVWYMMHGWKEALNLLGESAHEYDMIIKTRPDVSSNKTIDLSIVHDTLSRNQRSIIVPDNHHYGYGRRINDWTAFAKPEVMQVYCDTISYVPTFQTNGFMYHPETMLAEFMHMNNINVICGGFDVNLRHLGSYNPAYYSKFGRWA